MMRSKEILITTKKSRNRVFIENESNAVPTVFLHGFTGTSKSWSEVISKINTYSISIDIVGHGESYFNNLDLIYSENDWCEDLSEILSYLKIETINLCGYSMGGRLALAFTLKYPEKVNNLILESTSTGIQGKKERETRYQEDLKLCKLISSDFINFTQKWESGPLFLNQESRNRKAFICQKKDRLSHKPQQLIKSLKVFSQGKMEYQGDKFSTLNLPIKLICGAEDEKYLKINKKMLQENNNCSYHIIPFSVHNVHLENVDDFVEAIKLN